MNCDVRLHDQLFLSSMRLVDKKEIDKETVNTPGGKQVVVYVGPKVPSKK